jgi:uncharacterized damage-inducible protein DinB
MESDIGSVCRLHIEFMKWADDTTFAALLQVPADRLSHDMGSSFQSMLGTLNHAYLAEQVWIKRVQGNPFSRIADFEAPADLNALGQAWPGLHRTWMDWSRSVVDWQQLSVQGGPQGKEYQMPLWQIVMHLVNHGSYHRGQVATMLRQNGIKPPGTDLVAFYRTLKRADSQAASSSQPA